MSSYIPHPTLFDPPDLSSNPTITLPITSLSYYGIYGIAIASHTDSSGNSDRLEKVQEMWQAYIDQFFPQEQAETIFFITDPNNPSQGQISLYDLLHDPNQVWPDETNNSPLSYYNDYWLIQGMFATLLRDYFYNYLPNLISELIVEANDQGSSAAADQLTQLESDYTSAFADYLNSDNRSSFITPQNSVIIWVWEMLLQLLSTVNNSTLTQTGYMLAMSNAELTAATNMAAIQYIAQSDNNDYQAQTYNMAQQKNADVFRSQRSADGKQGQLAQSMVTTWRDASSQLAQLMISLLDSMESMYQAVLSK